MAFIYLIGLTVYEIDVRYRFGSKSWLKQVSLYIIEVH